MANIDSIFRKESKKLKILAIIIIFIGILSIVVTFYFKYEAYLKEKNRRYYLERNWSALNELEKGVNFESFNMGIGNEDSNFLGIILIPKINVKALIKEGIDSETLKYYVGHFESTCKAGENGNFALAGHRNSVYNELFRDLHMLNGNDEILVRTKKGEYKYAVQGCKVVKENDLSVLNETKEPVITLITCTNNKMHRYIVWGKLIE